MRWLALAGSAGNLAARLHVLAPHHPFTQRQHSIVLFTALLSSTNCDILIRPIRHCRPALPVCVRGNTTANKWARTNKKDAPPAAATAAAATAATAAVTEAAALATEQAQAVGPLGGTLVTTSSAAAKAAAARPNGSSGARLQSFHAAQQLSNYLLVVLQYWGLGPGALLCTFLLLVEVRVNTLGQVRSWV